MKLEEQVRKILTEHGKLHRTLKEGMCTNDAHEKLMTIINTMKNTLEAYERADYNGEWNDVDGGFSARHTLALLEWDTGGEWFCEQHPFEKHPHDDCPGPGVPKPEAMLMQKARSW